MITSGFSLAFNGKNILENSNEMLWQRNIYQLTTNRVSANKNSGYSGDTVEITSTSPAWNERFSSYSITGAILTGNTFEFTNSDVTAQSNYETAKNVTTATNGHGTVTATPKSGFIGTQVTLTNTPNTDYSFKGYSITGAELTGNQFILTGSDVTVMANFNNYEIIYESTAETAATAIYHNFTANIPDGYTYVAIRFDAKDGGGIVANNMTRQFNSSPLYLPPAITRSLMGNPNWTPVCSPVTSLTTATNQCETIESYIGNSRYITYCRAGDIPRTSYSTFNYVWGYKSTGYSAALNGIWRYRDNRNNTFTSLSNYSWTQTDPYRDDYYGYSDAVPLYTKNLRIGLFNNISDALSTAW